MISTWMFALLALGVPFARGISFNYSTATGCPPGSYLQVTDGVNQTSSFTCPPCPRDHWQDQYNQSSCNRCKTTIKGSGRQSDKTYESYTFLPGSAAPGSKVCVHIDPSATYALSKKQAKASGYGLLITLCIVAVMGTLWALKGDNLEGIAALTWMAMTVISGAAGIMGWLIIAATPYSFNGDGVPDLFKDTALYGNQVAWAVIVLPVPLFVLGVTRGRDADDCEFVFFILAALSFISNYCMLINEAVFYSKVPSSFQRGDEIVQISPEPWHCMPYIIAVHAIVASVSTFLIFAASGFEFSCCCESIGCCYDSICSCCDMFAGASASVIRASPQGQQQQQQQQQQQSDQEVQVQITNIEEKSSTGGSKPGTPAAATQKKQARDPINLITRQLSRMGSSLYKQQSNLDTQDDNPD